MGRYRPQQLDLAEVARRREAGRRRRPRVRGRGRARRRGVYRSLSAAHFDRIGGSIGEARHGVTGGRRAAAGDVRPVGGPVVAVVGAQPVLVPLHGRAVGGSRPRQVDLAEPARGREVSRCMQGRVQGPLCLQAFRTVAVGVHGANLEGVIRIAGQSGHGVAGGLVIAAGNVRPGGPRDIRAGVAHLELLASAGRPKSSTARDSVTLSKPTTDAETTGAGGGSAFAALPKRVAAATRDTASARETTVGNGREVKNVRPDRV